MIETQDDSPDSGDDLHFEDDAWLYERIPTPTYCPPIFFSYPTPITSEQNDLVKQLYRLLSRQRLTPRTLGVNENQVDFPLRRVRQLINESQGLMALALKKTEVHSGQTMRRHRHRQVSRSLDNSHLTSPWIHIEAAMAYQLALPILLVVETGVELDGLLERGVIAHQVLEFDPHEGAQTFLRSDMFHAALDGWVARVRSKTLGWTVIKEAE